ncbi:glycosyltransferase family 2 protein [bacterium]|nr:glycosyltransferase family 2 protein [bacterium]
MASVKQMIGSPGISVVVFTYNRNELLAKCLESLLAQQESEPFELVVFDNGSTVPVSNTHKDLLASFPGDVTVVREEVNFLSPRRWINAISHCTNDWVLLPGDDDIALPNYLTSYRTLIANHPSATMVSAAYRNIDDRGRIAPGGWVPPQFDSAAEALSALLSTNQYGMPASGIRRSAMNFSSAPMTRSSFDWWLWIQAWMAGTAAVTSAVTTEYRVHGGQEQHSYGKQGFTLDGARMISGVLSSQQFTSVIARWDEKDRVTFVERILEGPGLNNGDSRWGPLLQIRLADLLRDLIDPKYVADLVSQASAQAGVIAPVGAIRTAISDSRVDRLPSRTWTRVPVSAEWDCSCQQCSSWRAYLNLPELSKTRLVLRFHCPVATGGSTARTIALSDLETGITVHLSLDSEISEPAVAPLLEAVGQATGRAHGFETESGIEARALASIRKIRALRSTKWLETKVRLLTQRSSLR